MGKKVSAKEGMTKKIMDYVALHQNEELSLDMIARELNYSKFYMGRVFAETTGITVHKYIQEHRLAAAAQQLSKTDRSVIEIAFDAGYSSHQAFTRAFSKRYQCSPQDYRKNSVCWKNQVLQKKRKWLVYGNQKGRMAA